VLQESKIAEYRVAIVPADARRLIACGASVLIQAGAADGAGFSDQDYVGAGVGIASSAAALIEASDVVIKVKEPVLSEIEQLRPGQLYISFLHLAALPELIEPLARSGATILGYETIKEGRDHPVLRPMSRVAGALSFQIGEHYLEATNGGRGVLLPGVEGHDTGKVTIVGSGVVGEECGRLGYAVGSNVVFFDADPARVHQLAQRYPRARCLSPEAGRIGDELMDTDLLIGGVYVTGARAPRVVTRDQVARMPARAVAVDVAIDQGGCLETSRPTTHAEPVFEEAGVIHYCVTNMPSMVPRSASIALSGALLPYLTTIIRLGVDSALAAGTALSGAINVRAGRVVLDALVDRTVPSP